MAFESKKTLDFYDKQWRISTRLDSDKKLVNERLVHLNSNTLLEQINDRWSVMVRKTTELDEEYGLSMFFSDVTDGVLARIFGVAGKNRRKRGSSKVSKGSLVGRVMHDRRGGNQWRARLGWMKPSTLYRPRVNVWEFPLASILKVRRRKGGNNMMKKKLA